MPPQPFDVDSVIDTSLLRKIPPQPQYQGALQDQLKALQIIATRFGLYDASDYLRSVSRTRFTESNGKVIVEGDDRPLAEYDHVSDGDSATIYKRGPGFYGETSDFDFSARDLSELKAKLRSWGYTVHAAGHDLLAS